MKHFIFVTPEGYTYQPNSHAIEPDVENCQVLGFGKGGNVAEAFENLVQENSWLLNTSYNQVIAYELKYKNFSDEFELQHLEGCSKSC